MRLFFIAALLSLASIDGSDKASEQPSVPTEPRIVADPQSSDVVVLIGNPSGPVLVAAPQPRGLSVKITSPDVSLTMIAEEGGARIQYARVQAQGERGGPYRFHVEGPARVILKPHKSVADLGVVRFDAGPVVVGADSLVLPTRERAVSFVIDPQELQPAP